MIKHETDQAYGQQRLITVLPWGKIEANYAASMSVAKISKQIKLWKRTKQSRFQLNISFQQNNMATYSSQINQITFSQETHMQKNPLLADDYPSF